MPFLRNSGDHSFMKTLRLKKKPSCVIELQFPELLSRQRWKSGEFETGLKLWYRYTMKLHLGAVLGLIVVALMMWPFYLCSNEWKNTTVPDNSNFFLLLYRYIYIIKGNVHSSMEHFNCTSFMKIGMWPYNLAFPNVSSTYSMFCINKMF